MWKLESPSFKLIGETKPFEMLQIGSGAVVPEYKDIVERNSVGVYMIDNGPGELPDVLIPVGRVAAKWVFSEALEYQNAGISRAMHITLMLHDEILVHPLPEVPEGSFPSVASSWKELTKLLGGKGIKLAGCQALA